MTVPLWQAGTTYEINDVVVPNAVQPIVQTPINNPGFELGNINWTLGANMAIGVMVPAFDGTQGLTFTPIFSVLHSESATNDVTADIAPGQTVRATCQYREGDKMTECNVQLRWLTSGMAFISSDNGPQFTGGFAGWNEAEVEAVAPPTAAFVAISLLINVPNSDGTTPIIFDTFNWDQAFQPLPTGLIYRATVGGKSGFNEPIFPTTVALTNFWHGIYFE